MATFLISLRCSKCSVWVIYFKACILLVYNSLKGIRKPDVCSRPANNLLLYRCFHYTLYLFCEVTSSLADPRAFPHCSSASKMAYLRVAVIACVTCYRPEKRCSLPCISQRRSFQVNFCESRR